MDDEEAAPPSPQPYDRKGKSRALIAVIESPTDRTPLLAGSSRRANLGWQPVNESEDAARLSARRRLWGCLLKVFLISLLASILFLCAVVLLAWSYASRAAGLKPQDVINHHLVYEGPHKLDVLEITNDGGVWVSVQGKLGVDVCGALGINAEGTDSILKAVWKGIGRQGVRSLEAVSLNLSTISVLPELDPHAPLTLVDVPLLKVPLSVDSPKDGSWLKEITVRALVRPTTNVSVVEHFLDEAWRNGYFAVRADADQVFVRGVLWHQKSWRTKFYGKLSNIQASLRLRGESVLL